MKSKVILLLFFLLLSTSNYLFADVNSTTEDMFGLKLEVEAPYVSNDPTVIDTVYSGLYLYVTLTYANKTDQTQQDFQIFAYLPNRIESYTEMKDPTIEPDYIDPYKAQEARWDIGDLAPSDSGKIEFKLEITKAPADTIHLTLTTSARAKWTPVTEVAYECLLAPGGRGIRPYPDLTLQKEAGVNEIFPNDTIIYTIAYENLGMPGSVFANNVSIIDTLPKDFEFIEGGLDSLTITPLTDGSGRTLLIWEFPSFLNNNTIGSFTYKVKAGLITNRDTLTINHATINTSTSELIYINNDDTSGVLVKPKIDLSIVPQDAIEHNMDINESKEFIITCRNLSSLSLNDINLGITISDGISGPNIYNIANHTGTFQDSTLSWKLKDFLPNESRDLSFTLQTNNISVAQNYEINFSAIIDTIVSLADGFHNDIIKSNNYDNWLVNVDATPDFSIKITPNANSAFTGETIGFNLECTNNSVTSLSSTLVTVNINDGLDMANIYSPITTDGTVSQNEQDIEWEIPALSQNEIHNINFELKFDKINKETYNDFNIELIAEIDSSAEGSTDDKIHNSDKCQVLLDATPDLKLFIAEINDIESTYADSTVTFKVECENLSSPKVDPTDVIINIDDDSTANIYTLSTTTGSLNENNDKITWSISPIDKDEKEEMSFQLTFDQIEKYGDFLVNLKAATDTVEVNENEKQNNEATANIFVDATPDLKIVLKEAQNLHEGEPDSQLDFILTCTNLSYSTFDSIDVQVKINGSKIYSVAQTNSKISQKEAFYQLDWKIEPLSTNESIEIPFSVSFDKIDEVNNYDILLTASIEDVGESSHQLDNNKSDWNVSINAAPVVLIDQIELNTDNPELRNLIEYTVHHNNRDGNYPAKNAIMTIEKPENTYLLYYIQNGTKHTLTDTTLASIQISLGNMEPGYDSQIYVGLRLYSYKQLAEGVRSPLSITFKAKIDYEGGDPISRSKTDQVYFDPAIADLILDKNIVEPGYLPLGITFKSSDFGKVDIKIYNLAGEFIKRIYQGPIEKGDTYKFNWDGVNENGSAVSSGVYFVFANSKVYNGFKKVIIVK